MTRILNIINIIFTIFFTLEMIVKLCGLGLHAYLKDAFNLFDAFIVTVRCFRLLRILKLARFLPSLQLEISVLFNTFDEVVVFNLMMICFILMFSLIGMVLFGKKFCFKHGGIDCSCADLSIHGLCECERTNFDTFLNASLTVFQILTLEDWNEVLFNGMRRTTPWSALYFFTLITLGNYVLFNLLIAIIVEGFQKEKAKKLLLSKAQKAKKKKKSIGYRILRTRGLLSRNYRDEVLIRIFELAHMENFSVGSYNPSLSLKFIDEHEDYEPHEMSPLMMKMIRSRACWDSAPKVVKLQLARQLFITRSAENLKHLKEKKWSKDNDVVRRRRNTICAMCPRGISVETQTEYHVHRSRRFEKCVREMCPRKKKNVSNDVTMHNDAHSNAKKPAATHSMDELRLTSYLETTIGEMERRQEIADWKRMTLAQRFLRHRLIARESYYASGLYKHQNHAFYCIPTTNSIRKFCLRLTKNKIFDLAILVCIIFSCLAISLEKPSLEDWSWERKVIRISNYLFTFIFTIEMLLKLIAHGLIIGPNSYLKNPWNILDGFIVIASMIDVSAALLLTEYSPKIFHVIKALRLLRAFRPLRFISRAPSLRLAVEALLASLKEITFVLCICGIFFVIFGILGVQLYKGSMHFCYGETIANVTNKNQCENSGNIWVNSRYNFDHLGQALLTLFTISTLDGWVKVMHQGIDAVGEDLQPIRNNNKWQFLYFVSFILMVGFLVVNMFVGVLVDKFQETELKLKAVRRKKRYTGPSFYGKYMERQTFYSVVTRRKSYSRIQPVVPSKKSLKYYVTNKYFEMACDGVILLNIICLSSQHYGMSKAFVQILQYFYMAFTIFYILQALLEITGFGPVDYIKDRWHWLDFAIILLSVLDIVVHELNHQGELTYIPMEFSILRWLQLISIARTFLLVIKLVRRASGIWNLVWTLNRSLPDMGNITVLCFILFFIFAALGVELFGRLECSKQHPCDGLDEHAHFRNFGMAFLTLGRIFTGDNWSGIFKDALRDDCDNSRNCVTNCCASEFLTIVYFVTFILCAQFILLNVVVAMLMKGLKETHRELFEEAVAKAYIAAKLNELSVLPDAVRT